MIIYVNNKHQVYTTPRDDCAAIETDVFDGLPPSVIECYKYYPSDDKHEEFVQAWASTSEISCRQAMADLEDITVQSNDLIDAMASMVEEVYQQDLEIIEGE